jgi:ribosome-binding factor A
MIEGKRQKQISSVLIHDLNEIFQRLGLGIMDGGMVSISSVKVTPDLLEARIYLSLFQVKDPEAAMKRIEDRSNEIKRELANRIKHQVRRIPVLRFFKDDTLDNVFKMEELFKNLHKDDEGKSETE